VQRPVTTLMFVLFFVILGVTAYFNLNVERYPQVDFPLVSIKTIYPGASPEEVEKDVLKEIEDAVVEVSEIKTIVSRAYNNFGFVLVEFNLGVDINVKAMELKDKVEAIANDLPDIVEKPIIEKTDPLSVSVLDIVLKSPNHTPKQLYHFADTKIKSFLTSIKGIASVNITGGREREIRIKLDTHLMKGKFVTILDVIQAVKAYNVNFPGGGIERKDDEINVRFYGEYQSIDEIKEMLLTTPEGDRFPLKEIALVEDGQTNFKQNALYNSQEVVLFSLVKVSGGNGVEIARQVEQRWPALKAMLEPGMEVILANDTTSYTMQETHDTIKNILLGIFLTIFVLLVFTANLRTTFITAIVLPTSLIAAMFFVSVSGFTINSMTLLAAATVLGTLIANAIIIIESAVARMERGQDPETAAIEGTKDVTAAVLASSGTNLAVFIPIGFMGGIVGEFMGQFGMTVVYATLISIAVSFSLTPMLIAKILRQTEGAKKGRLEKLSDWINAFIIREYKRVFEFLFRNKILSISMCAVIFMGLISLAQYVGNEFIPASDVDKVEISIKTPLGSSIAKTMEKVRIIEDRVRSYPEVADILSKIGENGVENASILLNLVSKQNRTVSDLQLTQRIIPDISDIPDIEVDVKRAGSSTGEADLTIHAYGPDYEGMVAYAEKIKTEMNKTHVFRSVSSSHRIPKNEYRFIPDQKKLKMYGISNRQIAATIRSSIYGDDTNIYRSRGESYDIRISLNEPFINSHNAFNNMYVASRKGMIGITELGEVVSTASVPELMRRDRRRIVQIDGYIAKGTSGEIRATLDKTLATLEKGDGYGYYYAGQIEKQSESQKEIGKAFLLAIIFTYMVLAAIMNSMIHPFTIATSIVTSFAGVFALMFFMDASINIASMLAIIMLVGLVVNGAILLLENAVNKIREGQEIKAALWESASERLRTILMTSIAIIFGTAPQLWATDIIKPSMGVVIIGGMTASIFFTLTLMPLLFYFIETAKQWFAGKRRGHVGHPME